MPLFIKQVVGENGVLGIWKITETTEELERISLPNQNDQNYLREIRHPERYRQALAARVLTYRLLSDYGAGYPGIAKDNLGKPYLPDSSYHISLSHTKGYAAVIVHPSSKVGIDIEEISNKLIRVKPRFLSKAEQVVAGEQADKLAVYWCIKEAIYKIYRNKSLSFSEIQVKDFELGLNGTLSTWIRTAEEERELLVSYRRIATFSTAWVIAQ